MKPRHLLALSFLVGTSFVLPSFAQQQGQEKEPADLQQQRAKWLIHRRSGLSGKIPPLGRAGAVQQTQQMRTHEQAAFSSAPLASLAPSQQASLTQWTQIGPQPLQDGATQYSGRVTALAVDPTNENIVFAGAAEGGIWRTTDGGSNWTPLTDHQGSLSSGSIAIDPNNHNTIYYGTGEEDFFGDEYPGVGILKSTDDGNTWSVVSNKFAGGFVGGVAVSPGNSNLLMAVVESPSTGGIWRSTDAGASWTKVTPCVSSGDGVTFDPTNGNTIYAGCFSGPVYKSTDAGVTWNQILPGPNTGSAVSIAVAKSSPSTVFVLYGTGPESVLYKSTNGGASWTSLARLCFVQCAYNNVIAVDPTNANVVFDGEVGFDRSLNGASTWDNPTGSTVQLHSDNHAIVFSAAGDKIYVGSDGGVFSSTNFTTSNPISVTWSSLNATLAITQFYPGIATDPDNAIDAVGGTQDNGTNHYTGSLLWNKVFCCDGGYAAIDPTNPSTFYVTCQGECIEKTTSDGSPGSFTSIENGITGAGGFAFINPLVIDPSNHLRLYYAAGQLYQTMNGGANWAQITGPSFTLGIEAVAPALSNQNMVYLSSNGVPWVTTNALSGTSSTWTRRNGGLPNIPITDIAIDPTNPSVAYVAISGFSISGSHHVFKTTNAGVNWTDISGNLPNAPAESIVIDPAFPGTLYVGTDVGVFGTSNGGATWNTVVTGLPNVVVMSLQIHPLTRVLRAGTYGRSTWDLQLPQPTPPCTASTVSPSVTICKPAAGATVSSPVNVVAETTDSHAVRLMQLYVDSVKKFETATPTLNTSVALGNGSHTVTVQAYNFLDQHYNKSETITVGTSSCVVSTVNPSVTICTPANGATVTSPVHIVAKTTDSHTVTAMKIYVDNVAKFSTNASSIDTSIAMTTGSHFVVAQAWDNAGQVFKKGVTITVH